MAKYELCQPDIDDIDSRLILFKYELGISEVTSRLLLNRGISQLKEAKDFLQPSIEQLHDPFLLAGMDRAADRVKKAIKKGEKIIVYGDYDVDGVTSVAMLYLYIKSLGGLVDIYIPSRKDEGYGLHEEALKVIRDQGAGLVITVDCGITAVDQVKAFNTDMDIIITDHHNPAKSLPDVYAVINPKLAGQTYPFVDLAGVGVAAKLVQAIGGTRAVSDYIDLIAIGTIADIVPLVGENRVFAALGLRAINENPRPGIKALIDCLDLKDNFVDSARISFGIGPCLNAPGRMSTYHKGYELLVSDRLEAAMPIAHDLIEENEKRKETEAQILESALENILVKTQPAYDKVLVVAGEGWHPGVIGIVASRIVEEYNRPSVVISIDQESDIAVGSARSIKGFDLYEALCSCKDLFVSFGGHKQAAGLSLHKDNIEKLRKRLCDYADKHLAEEALIPKYLYDLELKSEHITADLHKEIEMLAPFGFGNPTPRFFIPSAHLESKRLLGKEKSHLKLALAVGQRSWDGIGFNMAGQDRELEPGCELALLTSLRQNEWRGVVTTQLQLHSLQRVYSSDKDIDSLLSIFYEKHFNVFLERFMYNDSRIPRESHASDNPIKEIDIKAFVDKLRSCQFGMAVLVYTPYAGKALLDHLRDQDFCEPIPIRYNIPSNEDGAGRNTIVLAPDMAKIPFENYHTIFVPDSEYGLVENISQVFSSKKAYRILMDDMPGQAENPERDFYLDRDQLTIIYRWLKAGAARNNFFTSTNSLSEKLKADTGYDFNEFQLLLALEAFKELGFINIEAGNQYFRIKCVENPKSRQLSESKILTFHRSWFRGLNG